MDRLLVAFNMLFSYQKGTLWRVREDLWKEIIHGYDSNSNRTWHPALSIRSTPLVSYEAIPVLHGTSKGSQKRDIFPKKV